MLPIRKLFTIILSSKIASFVHILRQHIMYSSQKKAIPECIAMSPVKIFHPVLDKDREMFSALTTLVKKKYNLAYF